MQRLLARVFAMHPLAIIAGLCLIPITVAVTRWAWMAPGASERAARAAANELSNNAVKGLTEWADRSLMPPINSMVATVNGLPKLVDGHATRIENKSQTEIRHAVNSTDALVRFFAGGVFEQITSGWEEVHHIHKSVDPAVSATVSLLGRYEKIPDQLASSRAWKDVEKEIICRQTDIWGVERGYAGCMKSGIIGVIQEAKKVGGIFTQKFPELSDAAVKTGNAVAGITDDGHSLTSIMKRWAEKNIDPHPTTFWQKSKAALFTLLAALVAFARTGLL